MLSIIVVLPLMLGATAACNASDSWTHCDIENSGSQVSVGASGSRPGSHGNGGAPHRPSQPETPAPFVCEDELCRPRYSVVTVPDVTLADLASFVPSPPSVAGEPRGLGVAGMPVNVIAHAAEQRMTGRILDFDVTVRFSPAGFEFDYGDGTVRRTTSGGSTWAAAGLATFSTTPTSHVYERPGTYPVRVTALYSAAVDFGSGLWRPVDGVVRATAGAYSIRVVSVRTALVERTCDERPLGPGCE